MSNKVSQPTVFLPTSTRKTSETREPQKSTWITTMETDPIVDNSWSQRAFVPIESDHKTHTIKRPRTQLPKAPEEVTALRAHQSTISTYLRQYFLERPVCVLTQAGRIYGSIVHVDDKELTLSTNAGEHCVLAIDALLSIGEATS
ncbi:hypothetical protein [Sulfoacidibacillus ferrooxidans]|uniref:Uncharacterized protein n=1 Tax=Sulfoacidibacillus ferrooxidans TaxID=2005001 RepID=A0A9X1V611_9BACL|nr:hypothetical protein [Sulfoacidibacillus ferrooxidans]MCI0181949.1 hypothetical protein [Sulfoacidibacillus ferrooxidans]